MRKPKFKKAEVRWWKEEYDEAKRNDDIHWQMILHIIKNDLGAVRACIRKGADVNMVKIDYTVVHAAVEYGRLEILRVLIKEYGAYAEHFGSSWRRPIQLITDPEETIEKWLLYDVNRTRQIIECLVRDGGIKVNRLGRTREISFFHEFNAGTHFHEAVASEQLGIAKFLYAEGADPDLPGPDDGETPVHSAAAQDTVTMLHFLITQCHANVNAVDSNRKSPLYYCCRRPDRLSFIKCLVICGHADINTRYEGGKTLLHVACERCKDWPALKFLIHECGMDVNARDDDGRTPLFSLMQNSKAYSHSRLTKWMVEKGGADAALVDDDGDTVLHYYCLLSIERYYGSSDFVPTIRYLVESGNVDIHAKNSNYGETVFHAICDYEFYADWKFGYQHFRDKNIDLYKCLISMSPRLLFMKDNYGNTPLHAACHSCDYKVLNFLLDRSMANVYTKNDDGDTPLDTLHDEEGDCDCARAIRKRQSQLEMMWMRFLLTSRLGSANERIGLGEDCSEHMIQFLATEEKIFRRLKFS